MRRFTPLVSDRSGDRAGSSLMERFLANVYIDVSDGSDKKTMLKGECSTTKYTHAVCKVCYRDGVCSLGQSLVIMDIREPAYAHTLISLLNTS